jgi:RNase P subunit RPR2
VQTTFRELQSSKKGSRLNLTIENIKEIFTPKLIHQLSFHSISEAKTTSNKNNHTPSHEVERKICKHSRLFLKQKENMTHNRHGRNGKSERERKICWI